MRLKLRLRRSMGETADVTITADATTTIEDIAHTIAAADPSVSPAKQPTLEVAGIGATKPYSLDPTTPLADAPIGSGFDAAVVPYEGRPRAKTLAEAAALMRIHSGPYAGRVFPLSFGTSFIGRRKECDISIPDPLVSARHARIDIGQAIELIDLNSANGLLVDGGLVQRVHVIPGQIITMGSTEISFEMTAAGAADTSSVLERGGVIAFNRSPRVEQRYPLNEHKHPAVPSEPAQRMFPWPMIAAPILLGLAMFAMTNRPSSLFIILTSPMMMIGNFIGQRGQQGRRLQMEIQRFEEQIDALEMNLLRETSLERERRRAEAPPTAMVYAEALRLGPMLWTRRTEHWNFLMLRLGVGTAPSRNTVADSDDQQGIPAYAERVADLRSRFRYVDGVPLVESLPLAGALGVVGTRAVAGDVVRALGVQLFGLHSPNDLGCVAIIDPSWTPELDWMKWLPHCTGVNSPFANMPLVDSQSAGTALLNGLEGVIEGSTKKPASSRGALSWESTALHLGAEVGDSDDRSAAVPRQCTVLFVTHDAPVDRARLTQVIERGPDVGIYTVFVAPTLESLPAACRTYLDVSDGLEQVRVGYVRGGESYETVQVEGVSFAHAERFAKGLAPVVDVGEVTDDSSDLPTSVPLLGLLGPEVAAKPDAVIERWRQNNSIVDRKATNRPRLRRAGTLKAYIGQSSPDAMTLDLRTQGPHALVGGTTGSGKSEFLQAWVLGMAVEYSPDRVTFLFVDYKGGSAFADCVDLPHCVGLVTDLSPHLVRRALTSLRAELHHREHLFNRKKVKDLLELEKRQDPEAPPALVLVIDEFAALANEVPEFVDGVVDIAQRGRSLGIHLIMATQRPAGVIKDNLRANTNLRVALRMADEADSKDVVGDPIAATFSPSIPGRGIAKTGPGRLVPFQSGYAGGWTSADTGRPSVEIADLRFGSPSVWETRTEESDEISEDDLGPTDQKKLVANLIIAAQKAGIPAPRRPWLDDLESTIDLCTLSFKGDSRIPLGLVDVPQRQLQEAAYFSPDTDGHLLIFGTSGSGKSALLRTIGIGAGANPEEGTAQVYGIDMGGGALRSIEALPHVGSIVAGDDVERIERLLKRIRAILDDRARRFSAAHAANVEEYRQITGTDEPRVFLLLDGLAAFRQEWDSSSARSIYFALFMRILAEGRPLGVHAVITADRPGAVPTAIGANISRRVVLRMADDTAYSVLGVPKDVLSDTSGPGRAIIDGLEAQIAIIGGSANVAEQTAAMTAMANELASRGAVEAPAIGSLPTSYPASSLPSAVAGQPVLGISDEALGPRGFEPQGAFLVAGPARSGKTTTMRAILAAISRFDDDVEYFHIGGRRAELRDFRPWSRSEAIAGEAIDFVKELTEIVSDDTIPGRIVVVVENILDMLDMPIERPMKELVRAISRSDHFLIADGDTARLASAYGVVSEIKQARHGIALKPDGNDGELFKVQFPKVKRHEYPEGRGILAEHGRYVTVQVPLVDSVPDVRSQEESTS